MYRIALILGMLILVAGLPAAQEAGFSSCSDTDWEVLDGIEDEYYALLENTVHLRDTDKLLDAAKAHVQWRSELLTRLPNCREAHEIGMAMVQMIGDGILTSVFDEFFAVSRAENPLTPALQDGSTRIYLLYLRDAEADGSATGPAIDADALCSVSETGADYQLLAGYVELIEARQNASTVGDLLDLAAIQVAWRAQLWRQLHACRETFDVVYALSHLMNDLIALPALLGAGLDLESNPYLEAIKDAQTLLQDHFNALSLQQGPEQVPPLSVNLPPCGQDTLEGMERGKEPYVELVWQMNKGVYSNEELIGYAEAMLAWRDDNLPEAPPCQEAVAVALMESWLTADFVADTVAMWIGVPAQDNYFAEHRATNNARLTALVRDIRSADHATAAVSTPESLPACDETQLDEVFDNMLKTVRSLSKNSAMIDDAGSLLSYGHYQAFWRIDVWRRLPACSEAFEMAMLMNEFASDAVSYHALRFVNVSDEDNPFWASLGRQLERFEELAAASGRD